MTDPQTPPTEAAFFTTIRGWRLTRGDARVLGGVSSGIAERLRWSVGWTRVAVVAAALFLNGIVLIAYAAAWALLPDRQGRIIAQDFGRGMPNVGALVAIGIVALLGFLGLSDGAGIGTPWTWDVGSWSASWPWDQAPGPLRAVLGALAAILAVAIPVAIVGGLIALVVWLARRDRPSGGTPAAPRTPDGTAPVYAAPPAWAADRQRQRAEAADAAQRAGESATAAALAGAAASTQAAYQSAHVATAAPAWTPPTPRPPRVPGPGAPFGLLTLAWLVLSGAAIAALAWQDLLAVHPVPAWFALFFTGLGVILILLALSGRRLGFLAFLSAVLMVPAAIMIVEADAVRDGWRGDWFPEVQVFREGGEVTRVEIGDETIVVGESSTAEETTAAEDFDDFDALAAFDGDYTSIVLPAGCYPLDAAPTDEGQSQALISQVPVTDDDTVMVGSAFTTLRVDAGTGIAVTPGTDQSATVFWPERGIACDVWNGETFSVRGDAPTLTLTTDTPDLYAAIVIEEVAS